MTQRKAVVPFRKTKVSGGNPEVRIQERWLPLNFGTGKITKKTLSDMIDAYLRAEADWQDAQSCMMAALESAGLEVED